MAGVPGWKSQLYGTLYKMNDERLAGFGNPPSDPEYQQNYPGEGRFDLIQTVIEEKSGKITEVVA